MADNDFPMLAMAFAKGVALRAKRLPESRREAAVETALEILRENINAELSMLTGATDDAMDSAIAATRFVEVFLVGNKGKSDG